MKTTPLHPFSAFTRHLLPIAAGTAALLASCSRHTDPQPAAPTSPTGPTAATVVVPCTDITTAVNWTDVVPGPGIDYIVRCRVNVASGGTLSIAKGVNIQFDNADAGLSTSGTGTLQALGSATSPIQFVGKTAVKGAWQGILIESNSPLNQLSHCVIRHAGGKADTWLNNGQTKAALALTDKDSGARLKLDNTTIDLSDGFGLYCSSGPSLTEFAANTFSNCSRAGVRVPMRLAHLLDPASSYGTGNGDPFVQLAQGSANDYVSGDVTWRKLPLNYRMVQQGSTSARIMGNLAIEPGTIIEMGPGTDLEVPSNSTGSLSAAGTAGQPIVFRGATAGAGTWQGIFFGNTSPRNVLQYCTVDGGGGSGRLDGTGAPFAANIFLGDPYNGNATVQNCTVSNSAAWGIYLYGTSQLTEASNTYSNNRAGNVRR